MKRAARHKVGSVVFDKRRKTWNFLQWVGNKRRSKVIGTLQEFPTKSAACRAAESLRHLPEKPAAEKPAIVRTLVEQYRAEKMPQRYSTRRSYDVWLRNHIVPKWGDCALRDIQARPVELWLHTLELSPRSKSSIRGMLRMVWDFAMWCGHVPTQRN